MIELGGKFATSHTRQVTELELVRQSAMRDYHELLGSDTKVVIQNLSLYEPRKSKSRLSLLHIRWNVLILSLHLDRDGI